MRNLLLLSCLMLLLVGVASGQQSYNLLDIIPDSATNTTGRFRLVSPDGNPTTRKGVTFLAPDTMTAGFRLKLPAALGTAGQFLRLVSIDTSGAEHVGVLDFATGSGGAGTPAGGNNQIQYNLSGVFAASPILTFLPTGGSIGSELNFVDTADDASFRISAPAANQAEIRLRRTSDNTGWSIYRPPSSLDLRFFSSTAGDRFYFTQAGSFGIGVSPARVLDVNGDSNFRGGLFPQVDSLYDIGSGGGGNRFRWGFAQIWNGKEIQITDSTAANHYRLVQGTSGGQPSLRFVGNNGSTTVMEFRNVTPGIAIAWDLIPSGTVNIGLAGSAFNSGNFSTLRAAEVDSNLIPNGTRTLGTTSNRWNEIWGGSQTLTTQLNVPTIIMDGTPLLRPAGGPLTVSGALGTQNAMWATIVGGAFHVGGDGVTPIGGSILFHNSDTTSSDTADLAGMVVNSGTAAEHASIAVESMSFGTGGNLYIREFTGGDVSCANLNGPGVWMGFRKDTSEIQICNGTTLKKVALL